VRREDWDAITHYLSRMRDDVVVLMKCDDRNIRLYACSDSRMARQVLMKFVWKLYHWSLVQNYTSLFPLIDNINVTDTQIRDVGR
jgi:hypothetical protein